MPHYGTSSIPRLYMLAARLDIQDRNRRLPAAATTTFGLREISTQGTQFLINGRKTFIRGTLECCIFPKTGHPPTDVESWKRSHSRRQGARA